MCVVRKTRNKSCLTFSYEWMDNEKCSNLLLYGQAESPNTYQPCKG